MRLLAFGCACLIATTVNAAGELSCFEERGTLKNSCISPDEVRANGSVRMSPLYTGGPNRITKTPYFLLINCANGISTLQDSKGVNFAGGTGNETPVIRSLSKWICEIKKVRNDPKVRQF